MCSTWGPPCASGASDDRCAICLLWAGRRNRAVSLVGSRADDEDRVRGEVWIQQLETGAPEFRIAPGAVARESDLLKFTLTGRDVQGAPAETLRSTAPEPGQPEEL